jgi:hypothetical protein
MVTASKKQSKQNLTFVPKSTTKKLNRRRRTIATNNAQRLEMIRDVLDAHGVGDPNALLYQRITHWRMSVTIKLTSC